jgi:hypothetical protein
MEFHNNLCKLGDSINSIADIIQQAELHRTEIRKRNELIF